MSGRQHSNCSVILPVVLSRDSLKIFVQKRFPHWSKLLIYFNICNPKNGSNLLDQEGLREFKGININLLDVHSKILVNKNGRPLSEIEAGSRGPHD